MVAPYKNKKGGNNQIFSDWESWTKSFVKGGGSKKYLGGTGKNLKGGKRHTKLDVNFDDMDAEYKIECCAFCGDNKKNTKACGNICISPGKSCKKRSGCACNKKEGQK